jgi:S-adenosylmethionine:tRNA ribosyltransferase-isomerase
MKTLDDISDFDYTLPTELIAQYPLAARAASRLLHVGVGDGQLYDGHFPDVLSKLDSGDVLVRNNTRVIPARMYGQKSTGGKIECLIERVISTHSALAHVKSSKSPKPGAALIFADTINVVVRERQGDLFLLDFDPSKPIFDWLELYGHMPLPPYIERADEDSDLSRYQTVYAQNKGAVAAPTAGLHFDDALFLAIKEKGVSVVDVTLHVGAGTFQPVRVEKLDDHIMHHEWLSVTKEAADAVNKARKNGGRVVAVGTTSVRCLETASDNDGILHAFEGETDLFIRPGYVFKCVDALITNFHLPQSTLLMLVAAFAGYDLMMQAYAHAIDNEYRFFSYGDAMWISR